MEHNRDASNNRSRSTYLHPAHYSHQRNSRQPDDRQRRNSRGEDRQSSSKSSIPSSRESNYKIVEYSDVSSEDFSAPEAGEIEDFDGKCGADSKLGVSITVRTGENVNAKKKKHGSAGDRLNFAMSPGKVRRVIIGSPISSSVSSRSKTPRSPPKAAAQRSDDLDVASLLDEDGAIDDEDVELLSDEDSDSDRRHRKSKKSKKAKKNKRKKKKRKRSLSSIESISDNESLLAVDDNAVGTPPHAHHKTQRAISPWEHTYTPVKPSPMSPTTGGGPGTPPLRPNSIVSMYSEESSSQNRVLRQHATPSPVQPMSLPLGQRNIASPHTPPPQHHHHSKKNAYTNSPIDVDHHQPQQHHLHHHHQQLQHHQQQQHYYHGSGQPRSPPLPPNPSSSANHRRHPTKSPGESFA